MRTLKFLSALFVLFVQVSFSQAPVINSIQGPLVICSPLSSPVTYSVSASNSPTSYSWTYAGPNTSLLIANSSSSLISISFSPAYANASYTLYCYASNASGSSATTSFVVNVFETPTVTFSGANVMCQGSGTNLSASGTLFQASSTTLSYSWSPPGNMSSNTTATVFAYPLSSVNYTVLISNGPCSGTGYFNLSVNPSPQVAVAANPNTICAGQSSTVTISGNGVTYSLGALGQTTLIPASLSPTLVVVTPTETMTYFAAAESSAGCRSPNIATFVQVNPIPTLSMALIPAGICPGDTARIYFSGTSLTYSINSLPVAYFATLHPVSTTTYIVAGGLNGCSSPTQQVVLSVGQPTVNVSATRSVICRYESTTLLFTGSGSLTFSLNGVASAAMRTVSPLNTMIYTVTVSDAYNCRNVATYPIVVNPCLGVEELQGTLAGLQAYPNPSEGSVRLKSEKGGTVLITDELGKTIRTAILEPQAEKEVSGLAPGIYFVISSEQRKKLLVTPR